METYYTAFRARGDGQHSISSFYEHVCSNASYNIDSFESELNPVVGQSEINVSVVCKSVISVIFLSFCQHT